MPTPSISPFRSSFLWLPSQSSEPCEFTDILLIFRLCIACSWLDIFLTRGCEDSPCVRGAASAFSLSSPCLALLSRIGDAFGESRPISCVFAEFVARKCALNGQLMVDVLLQSRNISTSCIIHTCQPQSLPPCYLCQLFTHKSTMRIVLGKVDDEDITWSCYCMTVTNRFEHVT